ncbi:hypothetical protein [Edaphobacter bradus]|uniref:hypothetical protein n=1 Tax=Edaphobacter bradus TaxID=2259016 RepID=UPI0021DFFCA1|nr:hypothetical protein [Edaphobacter bradus]
METNNELATTVERLAAAASLLEQAVERLAERQRDTEASIGRISATVEAEVEERLAAAEARLAAADAKIAELQASAAQTVPATVTNGRKTLPVGMATLLAKQGVTVDSLEAGALDAALTSLSLEQRIAVKMQLVRAGMLS